MQNFGWYNLAYHNRLDFAFDFTYPIYPVKDSRRPSGTVREVVLNEP